MLPRRFRFVFGLLAVIILGLLLLSTSSPPQLPAVSSLSESTHHAAKHIPRPKAPTLTGVYDPFGPVAQKPPEQANSASGDATWYSDWKWMNPFSSSTTLDDNRTVLPPLKPRPPIYTFYDATKEKDAKIIEAEKELVLVWRRAWWAKGFKPIVLIREDAMHNPLYEHVQLLSLDGAIENEVVRWLAWGHMGSGILANWLLLPMAPYEDPLISYLRRGEYPTLTRYEGLGDGLFCGEKKVINAAINQAINNKELKNAKSIVDVVPKQMFDVDLQHDGIALYDLSCIQDHYKSVSQKLTDSKAEGLAMLSQLINSHLHMTWQNTFSAGMSALNPLPHSALDSRPWHMFTVIEPALQLARNLTRCSKTPQPSSCPPNRPKCHPCFSSLPMLVDAPRYFRNTSTLFTIGTVLHPYTTGLIYHQRDSLDVRFIRRDMARDMWIYATMKEFLGVGYPVAERLVHFKEGVASEWGISHTLWLTAEHSLPEDLDWFFGFSIPRVPINDGKSETPVPGPERRPSSRKPEGPSEKETEREKQLLEKAKEDINLRGALEMRVVAAIEAWSLGDAEAWRFVRAFNARRGMERKRWEEEERKFAAMGDS